MEKLEEISYSSIIMGWDYPAAVYHLLTEYFNMKLL
jgi:hypothetical protein